MNDQMEQEVVWVCPNCTMGFHEPGLCDNCHVERLECSAGDLAHPTRKPLISKAGRVETHAPRWWLRRQLGQLARAAEELRGKS